VNCDAIGCIGRLGDGRLISMVLGPEAFAEDCARAAVVVSLREAASPNCAATLVDRNVWRAGGAVTLRWKADQFEQTVTLPPRYDRPWGHGGGSAAGRAQPLMPPSGDTTPRPQDLEAED
jgi:competence protein ComEC